MASKRYVLHNCTVNGTVISGITQQRVGGGVNFGASTYDGLDAPSFGAVNDQKPTITITTLDIKSILDMISLATGYLAITSFIGFWKRVENLGGRMSTASHLKYLASSGLAVINNISPQHNQPVTVDVDLNFVSSDGITNPLVPYDSQSLSGTSTTCSEYTLGPCVLDYGVAGSVPCESWSYDAGNSIDPQSNDGLPFPDYCALMNREPKFTANSPDLSEVMDRAPIAGAQVAADFYLRKMAPHGARVADATAEHIKIRFANAVAFTDSQDNTYPGFASNSIQVHAIKGTNPIISVDTACVLP